MKTLNNKTLKILEAKELELLEGIVGGCTDTVVSNETVTRVCRDFVGRGGRGGGGGGAGGGRTGYWLCLYFVGSGGRGGRGRGRGGARTVAFYGWESEL
jgi:hypothetical protein